jgi:hypothetical protein
MKKYMLIYSIIFFPMSAYAQSDSGPVFIGNHGQINEVTMGCPNKRDTIDFQNSYEQSEQARDVIGEAQDVAQAIQNGCETFQPGDTGLVIDLSGFLSRYTEMRMDRDENSYWVPGDSVSPIPGQPNNP